MCSVRDDNGNQGICDVGGHSTGRPRVESSVTEITKQQRPWSKTCVPHVWGGGHLEYLHKAALGNNCL